MSICDYVGQENPSLVVCFFRLFCLTCHWMFCEKMDHSHQILCHKTMVQAKDIFDHNTTNGAKRDDDCKRIRKIFVIGGISAKVNYDLDVILHLPSIHLPNAIAGNRR